MLSFAFWILSAAVVVGLWLAFLDLGMGRAPRWQVAALHGIIGATGLGVLIFALAGPARGMAYGVESFAKIAAGFFAAALAMGLLNLVLSCGLHRNTRWVIGVHAALAIAGYVLLLAYVSLG